MYAWWLFAFSVGEKGVASEAWTKERRISVLWWARRYVLSCNEDSACAYAPRCFYTPLGRMECPE